MNKETPCEGCGLALWACGRISFYENRPCCSDCEHVDPGPPARISVDEYGAALAEVVKLRAACIRRQVGAVIIGPDKRVLATGYNGMAPGETECVDGGCPRGAYSYEQIPGFLGNGGHPVPCKAWHAERNAVTFVQQTRGAAAEFLLARSTIYITCAPCPDCRELVDSVFLRVVHP